MTYGFYSVISGAGGGMQQELQAVRRICEVLPLRLMISFFYLRTQKEWSIPDSVEKTYLDSGAYSQINNKGDYPFSIQEYIDFNSQHKFDYVSTMDYPCDERFIAELTIKERIDKTINNTVELIDNIENLVPVIQGKTIRDYIKCIDLLEEGGLIKDYVGIGSICLRKGPAKIVPLVMAIKKRLPDNTKIHCYGLEIPSIKKLYPYITSSDSHTWAMGQQLGGRILFFDNGKLRSFSRNYLPAVTGLTLSLYAYNLYLSHIIRDKGDLRKFAV